jgi:DNA-binding response OmpR family regulator
LSRLQHTPAAGIDRSSPPLTILCIDDDPAILGLYALRLASIAARVIRAANGCDGFQLAVETQPDLILMDNDLPDEEGVRLLARLRSHPAAAESPVMMLTGSKTPRIQQEALIHGVIAVWEKPVNFRELFDHIGRINFPRRGSL